MWDRMSRCWSDVTTHAAAAGHWGGAGGYKWIIRSRPDVVWWRPLPSITEWPTDAIYTRARRLGMSISIATRLRTDTTDSKHWFEAREKVPERLREETACNTRSLPLAVGTRLSSMFDWTGMMRNVDDEKLSWWKYTQPQWGVCDLTCVWRDTRKASGSEQGGCVVADDQFAVIPAGYAGGYFGTETPNAGRHYPIPAGHENCQWPEGKMTCRMLDTGAKLMLAPFSFRINKWRFVHGEGPPFSKPKDTPAVCPCRHCT